MVDTFKCLTSHPIFPATQPTSLIEKSSSRRLPNMQYLPERWRMDNSTSPVNLLWTENDHVKIGSVAGIEVSTSAGFLVEVQVPSQQPGNMMSWVRIS